jgi:nucleotide-binding universal stress UspA family protein
VAREEQPLESIKKFEELAAAEANKILASVAAQAKSMSVPCETVHVPDRTPAEGIIWMAKEKKADLICMGSHGRRGLNRMLLGSQAHEVLTQASIPVLVCR